MSVLTHRMPRKNRHEKNVPKHKKCSGTFSFIVLEILFYLATSQQTVRITLFQGVRKKSVDASASLPACLKKTFFPFIVSRLHRPTLCQCEKHGWRPHALFGNPCGIYCFPLLSSTPRFPPVMASRGHGIVQTLKKPGGGVDECFFLAGRSPDAKKARIAPRLFPFGLSLPLFGP